MIKTQHGPFTTYQFPGYSRFRNLEHLVSTRIPPSSGLEANLSLMTSSDPNSTIKTREMLAVSLGIPADHLIFPFQTHGTEILSIDSHFLALDSEEKARKLQGVDGLITPMKGVFIAVLTADCAGILLYDDKKKIVASLHAGWRGTVGGIVPMAIKIMKEEHGCKPEHILAAISPCISGRNYETGEEVAAEFEKIFGQDSSIILRYKEKTKPHIHIPEANRKLLLREGLPAENIVLSNICTYQENQDFYSARRGDSGRFCTGIMMK